MTVKFIHIAKSYAPVFVHDFTACGDSVTVA